MKRFPVRAWLVALICLCLWLPFAALHISAAPCASCTSTTLTVEEQALWQGIAVARASAGLPALTVDAPTVVLARDRSMDMAWHHSFGHVSSAGTTFLDMMPAYGLTGQLAGETIQRNNYTDPAGEAARGLIASPEHHAILFDPHYRIGGVGSATGNDGIHYFTIIVIEP